MSMKPMLGWMAAWAISLLAILSACTDEQDRTLAKPDTRPSEVRLFAFADEHLADSALAAVVPEDFELTGVKRYGFDRHRKPWITVGVRMDGPVAFARAIFYVHHDEVHAREMFVEQADDSGPLAEVARGDDPQAAPWSERQLDIQNRCSVRGPDLFWCHARKGQVYLLVQSSAGGSGRDVTRDERAAAMTLLRAFGTYLEDEVPG